MFYYITCKLIHNKKEQPNFLDHSLFITSMIIISSLPFQRSQPHRSTTFLTTLNHGFVIFCDNLRGFLCKRAMPSIPYKSSISATFQSLLFINNLENEELQVLFEQMLDFTGFSGTRFLNLPLAYHSFFCYIKFAIRSISSVSVLSRTWQYRSIVICKEL